MPADRVIVQADVSVEVDIGVGDQVAQPGVSVKPEIGGERREGAELAFLAELAMELVHPMVNLEIDFLQPRNSLWGSAHPGNALVVAAAHPLDETVILKPPHHARHEGRRDSQPLGELRDRQQLVRPENLEQRLVRQGLKAPGDGLLVKQVKDVPHHVAAVRYRLDVRREIRLARLTRPFRPYLPGRGEICCHSRFRLTSVFLRVDGLIISL